jgi:hypothetical protein
MALVGLLAGSASVVQAATSRDYTLVVIPARYSVIQVAFDVARQNPVMLVSYQGEPTAAEPLLHAWNGTEWVYVSMKDFREVNFVGKAPSRAILVGDSETLPASLAEAVTWAPRVERVVGLSTAELVNDFGRIFKWKQSQWQWFSARYNLSLRDESEEARGRSWYDQPGPIPRPPVRDILGNVKKTPPASPPAEGVEMPPPVELPPKDAPANPPPVTPAPAPELVPPLVPVT